jgi:hypothetical protein
MDNLTFCGKGHNVPNSMENIIEIEQSTSQEVNNKKINPILNNF